MAKRKRVGDQEVLVPDGPATPEWLGEQAEPVAQSITDLYRDRVVELRRMRIGDGEPHPKNHRRHPDNQKGAVVGLLKEVGKAGVVYAFPADGKGRDGDFSKLMYYDGHLRREVNPDETWPVVVMDLTRAEADKMLLAMDATGALAEEDPEALESLLRENQTGDEALAKMLTDMAADAGVIPPEELAKLAGLPPTEIVDDVVPEPPAVPVTRPGDLWLLGDVHYECESCHKRYSLEEGKAMNGVCPCDG